MLSLIAEEDYYGFNFVERDEKVRIPAPGAGAFRAATVYAVRAGCASVDAGCQNACAGEPAPDRGYDANARYARGHYSVHGDEPGGTPVVARPLQPCLD